jgi:AAA family ATP:ADP antiporter
MKTLTHRLLDIREGEGPRTALMFGYIFLIIASLMIVKPVRNSLFLIQFGIDKLPYVFILTAMIASLVAWIYSELTKAARINSLIVGTLLSSIVSLLFFWTVFRLGYEHSWLLYAFYIWVAIFAAVVSAQFWLLANFVFDAREAKRLFGIIGAGAISGGILGGYLTNYLAPRIRTENLLFFCIAFLACCIVLFLRVWQTGARESYYERIQRKWASRDIERTDNPVKLIFGSRHLTLIAGIFGVSVIVATLVDYQFSAVASRIIEDTDRLTAFFGFWISTLSLISLGVQLVLTGKVMKCLGVAASLFFLPVGILFGAITILIAPGLASAIIIKLSDGSFKHSINKAGMELLVLPTPVEVKQKVKAFVDVFVDNLATGLAGALLVLLTIVLGFSVPQISLITVALIGAWIYMIVRVREEYVNAFRLAIEKRSIDLERQLLNLEDASVFESIVNVLEGENERQILYVLQLLEGVEKKELIPHLERLVTHPSDEVKAQVLEIAQEYADLDLTTEADGLTGTDDESVRTEAIRYLCNRSEDMIGVLKSYQDHPDYRIRGSAMICAARAWKEDKMARKMVDLKSLLEDILDNVDQLREEKKTFMKVNVARAIGISGNPELYPYLNTLLRDETREVKLAAIENTGLTRAPEFVPLLIQYLGTPIVRRYARQSLAEYGVEIVVTLIEHLEDPDEDIYIRRRIPRVLALIGSQETVNRLMANLSHNDLSIRYEVLKALNKIKSRFPDLKADRSLVEGRILDEAKQYYRLWTILHRQRISNASAGANGDGGQVPGTARTARQLLIDALKDRLDNSLEDIFRLLGLRYSPTDMYNAYLGIISNKPSLRADAVEFIDNTLSFETKRIVIPIVEAVPEESFIARAREFYGFDIPTDEECIEIILEGEDNWLKACALYTIAEMNWREHLASVRAFSDDPDPIVRETSNYCLERIGVSS